jgi:predicted acetyltransferase
MKDLAEFRPSIVTENGGYRDDRLRTYLAYADHWAFLINAGEEIAGFALARNSKPGTHVIGEFFIQKEYRRLKIGASAVEQILQEFPGHWEIPFQVENVNGTGFWRRVVSDLGLNGIETKSISEVCLSFTS